MLNKVEVEINNIIDEKIQKIKLKSGVTLYISQKKGFTKKMGMFGTIYGSIDSKFVDLKTGKETKVVDGIAHFLEHKLFEQEDENALDVFSSMGVDSNAYTSFDHTVYFFETTRKYEQCCEKLIEFVSNPYFTDVNVEKEKGIIAQEIQMYQDEPGAVVYYNLLRAMYKTNPINIDIAGSIESINKITKENLYTCYNTFYNPTNMFYIAIGDIDVEKTIILIDDLINKYMKNRVSKEVERITSKEQEDIVKKEIVQRLPIHTPAIMHGIKLKRNDGKTNVSNELICDIVNAVAFSDMSKFFEELYNKGIVNTSPSFGYESGKDFSHLIISADVIKVAEYEKKLKEHLEQLKQNGIDEDLFKIVHKNIKGELVYQSEEMDFTYRTIIESIIQKVSVYEKINIINKIEKNKVDEFLRKNIDFKRLSTSKILSK